LTIARFPITGTPLDNAVGRQSGTVLIDRENGDFHVRPKGRRRLYTLPLSQVAHMVCSTIIRSELLEKRALKRAKRAGRSR
jgi:hypothetical protein